MKFKQMTSLVALSFLFISAEAFAGKNDPIEGEIKGGSGKVTVTPKSSVPEVKATDSEDEGTSTSAKGPVLLEQNSAVVVDEVSGSEKAAQMSQFGDLTQSVYGHIQGVTVDTRGYGIEWWAPASLGGKDRLHDFSTLRLELESAETPEISDAGYSSQVAQFLEHDTDPKLWPADTRAWYTQNGADAAFLQDEAKRLIGENKTKVRQWPVEVQKMIVSTDNIRTLSAWISNARVKLNFRAK